MAGDCNHRTVRTGSQVEIAPQVASTGAGSDKAIDKKGISTKLIPQYSSATANASYTSFNDSMLSRDTKSALLILISQAFIFSPTSPLWIYTRKPVYWETITDLIKAHKLIRDSGLPNFHKCHILVQSGLNIGAWRTHLRDYWDSQICDSLKYYFPLGFDRSCPLLSREVNHSSPDRYSQFVNEYLAEELQFKAILGPFPMKPIQIHVSPLMIRDKQNLFSKRTIMDLSWPQRAYVNDGVLKDSYLQTTYELHYPSIDLMMDSLQKLGTSAQIYKVDISRAFRQIKVDPADIDLLGIKFDHEYCIDQSILFGIRNGSQIFHCCTDTICYIIAINGFHVFFNYIDNLIYIGLPSEIQASFFLNHLLRQLGLEISTKKLVPPSTSVVF